MVDPQARVMELQEQVTQLTEDKERLYKDLESYLMQNNSSSFWSGSAVLYDRISQAETDLKKMQEQKGDLEAQLKSCKDDLAHLRAMKRAADGISKRELERSLVLEKELAFYKQRGSQWLEEKNLNHYELEGLKKANAELEVALKESKANLDVQMGLREESQQKFVEWQRKASQLEGKLVECARIPELEKKMANSKEETERLSREMNELEGELGKKEKEIEGLHDELEKAYETNRELEEKLQFANQSASSETSSLKDKVKLLEDELSGLNNSLHSQSMDLEKADEAITSAKAQAEFAVLEKERELEETREMHNQQIALLSQRLKESESKLSHQTSLAKKATDAKVEALMQLSDSQKMVSDLKSKMGQSSNLGNVNGSPMKANGAEQSANSKTWWRGQHSVQS